MLCKKGTTSKIEVPRFFCHMHQKVKHSCYQPRFSVRWHQLDRLSLVSEPSVRSVVRPRRAAWRKIFWNPFHGTASPIARSVAGPCARASEPPSHSVRKRPSGSSLSPASLFAVSCQIQVRTCGTSLQHQPDIKHRIIRSFFKKNHIFVSFRNTHAATSFLIRPYRRLRGIRTSDRTGGILISTARGGGFSRSIKGKFGSHTLGGMVQTSPGLMYVRWRQRWSPVRKLWMKRCLSKKKHDQKFWVASHEPG